MFKYIHEREETSIVAKRETDCYVPQAGYFEFERIFWVIGDPHPSLVFQRRIEGEAGISVRIISEHGFCMAAHTFLLKDLITQFFRQDKAVFSAFYPIIFAVAAHQLENKLADSFTQTLRIDSFIAKCGFE